MNNFEDMRALNMDFPKPKGVELIELPTKGGKKRGKYGVEVRDTFNLHTHLAAVMANSLRLLSDNLHGWPCDEAFPEFDDWKNALVQVANKLEFVAKKSEIEDVIIDHIDFTCDDEITWEPSSRGTSLMKFPKYRPGADEYRAKKEIIDEVADRFKTEALEWINKYWWALWD